MPATGTEGLLTLLCTRQVLEVLGNYTYRLSVGQVWNARKLVHHRVPQQRGILMEEDDGSAHHAPRRSTRKTRGLPSVRFPHQGGR